MLVSEAMRTPVVCVHDDDPVHYAMELLLRHRIASVPVLDAADHLVGIVSEADLLRRRTGRDPRAHMIPVAEDAEDAEEQPPLRVDDVMTPRPLTVRPDADTAEAAQVLLDHGIRALPVVQGRRVVGVVARRDLLRAAARPDDAVEAEVRALLSTLGDGHPWDVSVEDGVVTLQGPHSPQQQRVAAVLARTVAGVARVVQAGEDARLDAPPVTTRHR